MGVRAFITDPFSLKWCRTVSVTLWILSGWKALHTSWLWSPTHIAPSSSSTTLSLHAPPLLTLFWLNRCCKSYDYLTLIVPLLHSTSQSSIGPNLIRFVKKCSVTQYQQAYDSTCQHNNPRLNKTYRRAGATAENTKKQLNTFQPPYSLDWSLVVL